jgi:hypothetical protein
MNDSIFVKCNCGSCNVVEFNIDEDLDCVNIAVWEPRSTAKPLPKKERIRWCDHVMKTGNPWADHTIVNRKDAERIVKFLTKYLEHGKTSAGNKRDRT